MSAIAKALFLNGYKISGTDRDNSDTVKALNKLGIKINIGHSAENVNEADIIVRNAAIKDDFPEIIRAKERNLPIFDRPEVLGYLMKNYKRPVCIAGTHGKTSTTSMITEIAIAAKCEPTAFIGAELPTIGGTSILGNNDLFIAEACEYCESFLSFYPFVSVILNVEADHLDYYRDIDHIKESFTKFALLSKKNGGVIVNADDKNAMDCVKNIDRKIMTFGINAGDIRAANIKYNKAFASFDLKCCGITLCTVSLKVPGEFNVYNSLAAAAIAIFCDIDINAVKVGLEAFKGSSRRFEYKGEYNGATVIEDYAHHPTEMTSTLNTAMEMGFKRVICAFQSHTYTRTAKLFDDFVIALKIPDLSVIIDIFSAREINTTGITAEHLAENIPNSVCGGSIQNTAELLKKIARDGDLILTMGAGENNKIYDLMNLSKS